jgi:hypothetical protein
LRSFPHVDHGYAVTSHASQGATVDHVIVNVDTTRSRELVNRQQFYVSLSRARRDAVIFTDSRESLTRVISRTADKSVALDAIESIQMRGRSSDTRLRPVMSIVTPREHVAASITPTNKGRGARAANSPIERLVSGACELREKDWERRQALQQTP